MGVISNCKLTIRLLFKNVALSDYKFMGIKFCKEYAMLHPNENFGEMQMGFFFGVKKMRGLGKVKIKKNQIECFISHMHQDAQRNVSFWPNCYAIWFEVCNMLLKLSYVIKMLVIQKLVSFLI